MRRCPISVDRDAGYLQMFGANLAQHAIILLGFRRLFPQEFGR